MGEFRQTTSIFLSTFTLSVVGLSLVAQAQNSPFAKKGKQAWETSTPTTTPPPQAPNQYPTITSPPGSYQPSGSLTPPAQQPISSGSYPSSYSYSLPKTDQAPPGYQSTGSAVPSSGGTSYPSTYNPNAQPSRATSSPASTAVQPTTSYNPGVTYDYPNYNRVKSPTQSPTLRGTQSQANGTYYPGRTNPVGQTQSQRPSGAYSGQTQSRPPYPNQARGPQSMGDKLGFGNIAFKYEGYLKAGAAATSRDMILGDGWNADFIFDGSLRSEVSAITQGGLEYGVAAEVRGQYDQYRRGFGGRVGDCPAGIAGCSDVTVNGTDYVLRGHTSRFYGSGANDSKDFEVQLESAHLFLRSAYGDVTVGRDDGAAYLFSLGAPSLLNVGASNSSVDYTGLDSVKTLNDASGFAEKITYTSPRLLGDKIGVGVQFGASYALDAKACGVDYCVRGNDDEPTGVLAPDLDNVMEFGLALDRKFDNGMSVEATATYARGSEQSSLAVFDDLQAFGLGLELGYMDWTLGGSYLNSNNGLTNGDYKSMDVGLTWQPSQLGFTVGYGHATDDNVGLSSDQFVAGVSYDWNDNFRLGTGVQHIKRDVNVSTLGVVGPREEDATSIFVEGRFTF